MKRFLAVQNIIHLKKRLEAENDPRQRAIIEHLVNCEEALLLLNEHKLSGRVPDLVRSPDIFGGPTPRLVPTSAAPSLADGGSEGTDFDHRRCPSCERQMRLVYIQPREPSHDDGYDVHHYHCETCHNGSRFVFERHCDEPRPASLDPIRQVAKDRGATRHAYRSGKP